MDGRYVNINGRYFDQSAWVLKAQNRSFLYGDGVFESIKYTKGNLLWFDDHWKRLSDACAYLGYQLGFEKNQDYFQNEILHTLRKNKIYGPARVRLHIHRNEGGLYTPTEKTVSFLILVESIDHDLFPLNESGLSVDIFEKEYKSLSPYTALKSSSALLFVLAGQEKLEKGVDELIILNEKDRICETISSNVFLVSDGTVYTPALESGCLPGVMRKQIFRLSKELGIEVVPSDDISVDLLPEADECFISNSISGIQWVSAYQTKRYYNEMASKISNALNQTLIS